MLKHYAPGAKIQDRELEAGVSTASGSSGATTKTSFDWPVEYRAAMQAEAAVVTADLHRFNDAWKRAGGGGDYPMGYNPDAAAVLEVIARMEPQDCLQLS